jgi:DNA integrity scanning protein DisA with diadenylate cyclase activity
MPKILKYKALETTRQYSKDLAESLATKLAENPSYGAYATVLIPFVVENMGNLQGFISTNYGTTASTEDNNPENICIICRDNMLDGAPTVALGCGHTFHSACINAYRHTGETRCPTCRSY